MRILFLSTWFPYPADNGSKIRVLHLLQALGQRHEVSLIAFNFETARPDSEGVLDTACCSIETVEDNPFTINRAPALRRFLAREPVVTRRISAMNVLTRNRMAQTQFDAVISSGAVMAGYVLDAPKSIFKVLEEHNSNSMLMHERFLRGREPLRKLRYWFSWQKTRRYERRLFGRFDLVTLVSQRDKDYSERYVHRSNARVEVVPNGVDCEWNRPGLAEPENNQLIYNGALSYAANFDAVRYFLREIYPLVKETVPQVTFKITGSTTGVDLADLRLDESARLTGYVDDIRPEVAGAAVCVIPLRDGGGTRLKILEALALGTPVVSTSKGAEGLAVESDIQLLIADEPGEFARQTVRLLRDKNLRGLLVANGRRLVEQHYDWRSIGRAYAELVESTALDGRRI